MKAKSNSTVPKPSPVKSKKMQKAIEVPNVSQEGSKQYITLQEFQNYMDDRKTPYNCKFSLRPFLDKMHEHLIAIDKQSKIWQLFDEIEKELSVYSDMEVLEQNRDKLQELLAFLFPSLFFEGQLGFITVPFAKLFVYVTPEMADFLYTDKWEMKIPDFMHEGAEHKANMDVANLTLKTFYGVDVDCMTGEVISFRNAETLLEKHFKINVIGDFVKGIATKPLKKLNKKQVYELLNEYHNPELRLKYLPPENFAFEGMAIGYLTDVTDVEILSKVKEMMVEMRQKEDHLEDLDVLQQMARSFLGMPEVEIGMIHTVERFWQESTLWSLLRVFKRDIMVPSFKDENGAYGKVLRNDETVIITDLQAQKHLSIIEEQLLEKGYRSLMLCPLHNRDGEILGVFEMASPQPYRFTRLIHLQMKEIISLFELGTNRFIQELEDSTRLTIQQQFSSVHSSVDWRFREVATKFYWQKHVDGKEAKIDPIVFKDLYPIYGQADIVGSSKIRNKSIKADLIDNLQRAIEVMHQCRARLEFHLLDVYTAKAQANLDRLQNGEFISSDETQIIDLLTNEIHPLLMELKSRYKKLPRKVLNDYFKYLDPKLNIVYRHRKAYEDSVHQLNHAMSRFIEQEDEKMQELLPHYFEKYTTDGVEYNIYLGQSLLPQTTFSDFFIKDFRLWQLIKMCEITHLVDRIGKELPVQLKTAQLIFVYNNTMSIRFNMDEKQFDVDGTYNVRYEILKKRIDKAVVKDTGERLTQSGKIAIVWLQEKDRLEYLEYLHHLLQKGYISDDIEELELEKLQGAEGLKALRVEVV